MIAIKPYRVANSKSLNGWRKIGLLGARKEIVAVPHEHIGMSLQCKPLHHLPQHIQELPVIVIIIDTPSEEGDPPISPKMDDAAAPECANCYIPREYD
jgi:hypothetical protein